MKTVYKPWGKEEWLELNDFYCYKRIYINAGHKTSVQFHNQKHETNYIISGRAFVYLGDSIENLEKIHMGAEDFFVVPPGKVHCIEAIEDLILQEVSTPQVDDVVRLYDVTGRENGKIEAEHSRPVLCILAAGRGTRIGKLSSVIHKCLLPIKGKAILSHIIDKTSKDVEIVIAVGHLKELIKEYCELAHADRDISFVEVENYAGPGSGPGVSLLACKDILQRPFYWSVADLFITDESLPPLDRDWVGISPTSIPEIYSTVDISSGKNIVFKNKSLEGYDYAFIGLAGVFNYKKFWSDLEHRIFDGEVVSAYLNTTNVGYHILDWYDVGTIESYQKLTSSHDEDTVSIVKLTNHFNYKVNDRFIKFVDDTKTVSNLQKRSEKLLYIPEDFQFKKNFYSYQYVPGQTLYDLDDLDIYKKCINLLIEQHWYTGRISVPGDFAVRKARERMWKYFFVNKKYKSNRKISQIPNIINDKQYDRPYNILYKIDPMLPMKLVSQFYGDLQFDNIIYNGDKFTFIDFRDSFNNQTSNGDVYYDAGKLYGGMLIRYNKIHELSYSIIDNKAWINKPQDPLMEELITYFQDEIKYINLDFELIKLNTALIWLSMTPLHPEPFSDILYLMASEMLGEWYENSLRS